MGDPGSSPCSQCSVPKSYALALAGQVWLTMWLSYLTPEKGWFLY